MTEHIHSFRLLILLSVYPLLVSSSNVLMQRTPDKLQPFLQGCYRAVAAFDGVVSYREPHFCTCTHPFYYYYYYYPPPLLLASLLLTARIRRENVNGGGGGGEGWWKPESGNARTENASMYFFKCVCVSVCVSLPMLINNNENCEFR